MRRTAAFLTLAALVCSQLAASRCDTCAPVEGTAAHPTASAHPTHGAHPASHHGGHVGDVPAPPHGAHDDGEGCLMMTSCGTAAVRDIRAVPATRLPAAFAGPAPVADPARIAADLAVEPPPPRLAPAAHAAAPV